MSTKKKGKVDRLLPTLPELRSGRRKGRLGYVTGHYNLIPRSETLHIAGISPKEILPEIRREVQPPGATQWPEPGTNIAKVEGTSN